MELVKQKVLSERGVYSAVRNVCWIIRHSSNGISIHFKIFASDVSCESLLFGSAPTSSLPKKQDHLGARRESTQKETKI